MKSCNDGAVIRTMGLVSAKLFWFLQSSLAGHIEGGCSSQVGSFHQSSKLIRCCGGAPLEAISAGLQSVRTCLQCDDGMRLTVSITLLQT